MGYIESIWMHEFSHFLRDDRRIEGMREMQIESFCHWHVIGTRAMELA